MIKKQILLTVLIGILTLSACGSYGNHVRTAPAGVDKEFVNTEGIIAKQIADIGNSDRCKGFCLYAYCNTFDKSDRARKELDSTKRQISKIKDG